MGIKAWLFGSGPAAERFITIQSGEPGVGGPDGAIRLKGHPMYDSILSLFRLGDSRLVSVSQRGIKIWESSTGCPLSEREQVSVYCAVSADGSRLVSGARDTVTCWNLGSEEMQGRFESERMQKGTWALNHDGTLLASGLTVRYPDSALALWDPEDGKLLASFGATRDILGSMFFLSSERLLFSTNRRPELWDCQSKQRIGFSGVGKVKGLLPDGSTALFEQHEDFDDRPRSISLVNTQDGSCISVFKTAQPGTLACAFSPDGQIVATSHAGADKHVYLWSASTGRIIRTFRGHEASVGALCFSATGESVFSGDNRGIIFRWAV